MVEWASCVILVVKEKAGTKIQTDTDDFLSPLRRLFLPPPANSLANTASSNTLTEAGYARFADENQPTVLSWILFPAFSFTHCQHKNIIPIIHL